ncbi:molybdopterin-binding protein [Lacunimicrobium album]
MLTIEYADGFSRVFGYDDLASLAGSARVDDVSTLDERRHGTGVRFESLVEKDRMEDASKVTLVSSEDGFQVTIPVAIALEQGVVLYALNGNPLTVEKGGPLRFFMPKTVSCQTKELPAGVLDNCANLKHLVRVRIGKVVGTN